MVRIFRHNNMAILLYTQFQIDIYIRLALMTGITGLTLTFLEGGGGSFLTFDLLYEVKDFFLKGFFHRVIQVNRINNNNNIPLPLSISLSLSLPTKPFDLKGLVQGYRSRFLRLGLSCRFDSPRYDIKKSLFPSLSLFIYFYLSFSLCSPSIRLYNIKIKESQTKVATLSPSQHLLFSKCFDPKLYAWYK